MSDHSGPFGWLTAAVTQLSHSDPDFARHAVAMDGAQLHLLGLIFSHCDTAGWSGADWQSFGESFRLSPRGQLIERYAPNAGNTCRTLLAKLKGTLWQRASYRRLALLVQETNARKWLAHAELIRLRDLVVLSRLPPAFRTSAIVKGAYGKYRLNELRYRIMLARRAYPEVADRLLARMIEKKGVYQDDWEFRNDIMMRIQFPPPPWQGDDRLRPICSHAELAEIGRSFRNCVRDRIQSILERNCVLYAYRQDGRALAVVQINADPILGWDLHESLGPNNRLLPAALHYDILRRFQAVGISCGRALPLLTKGGIAA